MRASTAQSTAALPDQSPRDGYRLNPLLVATLGIAREPRAIAVAAAGLLCAPPRPFKPRGRTPAGLDDLGFVRLCIQAGADWDHVEGRARPIPPLADLEPHTPLPGRPEDVRYGGGTALLTLLEAWGLQRIDRKWRCPGDVIVYTGHTAALGLLVHRRDAASDVVALAERSQGTLLRYAPVLNSQPGAYYAWPVDQILKGGQ